jgi:predicted membrane channel-forming protein YqfA (hemolysin III family)
LAALTIAIVQRTLLKGVDWQDALLPFAGFLSLVLDGVMLLLLAASFLTDVLKRRRLHHLIAALALGLLAVSAAVTRQTGLLYSAALVLLTRDIPYARIVRTFYRAALAALILLMLAQLTGLTKRSVPNPEYSLGYAMGMAHPNNFASAVTVLLFSWAYLRRWESRSFTILACLAVGFAVYRYTISRTALVIVLVYCLALILYEMLARFRAKNALKLIRLGFIVLLASSVWLMLYADQVFGLLGLDGSTEFTPLAGAMARFVNAAALYEQNGLRLFGSYIEFRSLRVALQTNQEAVILDSAYLYLVISQGVAATGVMLWLFGRSIRAQLRNKQYVLLITMGVFLLSGLMERFALDAAMNFALLSAFSALEQDGQIAKN